MQLPSLEPMPVWSRLHEAGYFRNGSGARTDNSLNTTATEPAAVACGVLSAPSGGNTQSAEHSGHYSTGQALRRTRAQFDSIAVPRL